MAIAAEIEVVETALWPQGDVRDPLGVWGSRVLVTGDNTGGAIVVDIVVPANKAGAFVYTNYKTNQGQLSGSLAATNHAVRLLTNWPDIDPLAGVQGFNTFRIEATRTESDFPGQQSAPQSIMDSPNDRFLLLFDPRPAAGKYSIVQLLWGENTNNATYAFEAYGYYWDRSVLNAPGGPRHPGSS